MKSSAAVAGRALIMLACVVGIPALALSDASWSEMLKKLQDFRWPAILDLASASTSASLDEAPRFTPSNSTGTPATGRRPAALAPTEAPSPIGQIPAVVAASSAVVPAGYQEGPAALAAIPPSTNTAGENATGAAPSAADPFHSVPDRLRQLGATYYLLESWGNNRQIFRFYCKMAVGGNADYTRYFEATHSDPLQAMLQVLRQVEKWREGRGVAMGQSLVE